jgi:hypothetical protein
MVMAMFARRVSVALIQSALARRTNAAKAMSAVSAAVKERFNKKVPL